MLSHDTRVAILSLHAKSTGIRTIASSLKISRAAVQRVIRQGTADPPKRQRAELLSSELTRIRDLHARCQGNLLRVHEELATAGIKVAYSTLTSFCRRNEIGVTPKQIVGAYHFSPGEEMQHDTSPHRPIIAGSPRLVHCASLVLCYSRMLFAQVYPKFNRFWCKVFLVDALRYFDGAAARCMLDNSSIVIAHGTGKNAVPAPEMAALAADFGFEFVAHELGDANRSARVERNFDYIERNFYAGREFTDVADCNAQLLAWCDKANATHKRSLRAAPTELFAVEKSALRRLPLHVRDPAEIVHRTVDALGFVTFNTNNYSAPLKYLDRPLDVIATRDRVRLFESHRLVCEHVREEDGANQRRILPEHKEERRQHRSLRASPTPHEEQMAAVAPEFAELVAQLKSRHPGRAVRAIRRLNQLYLDYPTEHLRAAIRRALDHRLYDLGRIESMVLCHLSGAFFRDQPSEMPGNVELDDESPALTSPPTQDFDDAEEEPTTCLPRSNAPQR